jgi:hypothetical protein
MISRNHLIAAAIAAALAAPAAMAQTGTPTEKQPSFGSEGSSKTPSRPPEGARSPTDRTTDTGVGTFRSIDTNKDGYISRDEAKNSAELNRQFGQLDKDGDGKLSPQEMSGWRAPATTGSATGDRVGAAGSSGVGTSTEPSGGTRPGGNRPPETPKKGY